jgi:hypothetical protein
MNLSITLNPHFDLFYLCIIDLIRNGELGQNKAWVEVQTLNSKFQLCKLRWDQTNTYAANHLATLNHSKVADDDMAAAIQSTNIHAW